jgi:hypothetical protein
MVEQGKECGTYKSLAKFGTSSGQLTLPRRTSALCRVASLFEQLVLQPVIVEETTLTVVQVLTVLLSSVPFFLRHLVMFPHRGPNWFRRLFLFAFGFTPAYLLRAKPIINHGGANKNNTHQDSSRSLCLNMTRHQNIVVQVAVRNTDST